MRLTLTAALRFYHNIFAPHPGEGLDDITSRHIQAKVSMMFDVRSDSKCALVGDDRSSISAVLHLDSFLNVICLTGVGRSAANSAEFDGVASQSVSSLELS